MFDLDAVNALVAEAEAALAGAEPIDVPGVKLGSRKVTIRFMPMTGPEWKTFTAVLPPRPDSPQDVAVGCNLDEAVRLYPRVSIFADGEAVDVSETWTEKIYPALGGQSLLGCSASLWYRYVKEEEGEIEAAGKALKGGPRKKRVSPESSASQSES